MDSRAWSGSYCRYWFYNSDFHDIEWPVKKIQDYYVSEYDKIYILGDAIDRGMIKVIK